MASIWESAIIDACRLIPVEIKTTTIYNLIKDHRNKIVCLPYYCPQCGEELPPMRSRKRASLCKSCKKENDDKERSFINSRNWEYEKNKFHAGKGTPSFRFNFMCRHCRLKEEREGLISLPYRDFLQSVYWKAIRDYVLYRNGWKCSLCHSPRILNVHHKTYEHHGEEHLHLEDLTVLCQPCHAKFHDKLAQVEDAA